MDYFFLENKLGFLWLTFWYGIEAKVHYSKHFKSASVFTAFCFVQWLVLLKNGSEKFDLSA